MSVSRQDTNFVTFLCVFRSCVKVRHWAWGLPSLLYNGYQVFPGGKVAGAWCWPPTPNQCQG